MKRLIATAMAASAFAAGCNSPSSPEAAPVPSVSASPTPARELKDPSCYPSYAPDYRDRKHFLAISSHVGNLTIVYQRDCGTQIWRPDENGKFLNGTRCTPKGHLRLLFDEPKNPQLRQELDDVFNQLNNGELCQGFVIDPIGEVDGPRP